MVRVWPKRQTRMKPVLNLSQAGPMIKVSVAPPPSPRTLYSSIFSNRTWEYSWKGLVVFRSNDCGLVSIVSEMTGNNHTYQQAQRWWWWEWSNQRLCTCASSYPSTTSVFSPDSRPSGSLGRRLQGYRSCLGESLGARHVERLCWCSRALHQRYRQFAGNTDD